MSDTDRVYISTEVAKDADVYHTRENCHTLGRSDPTEISRGTAQHNGAQKCSMCTRFEGGVGPQFGLARKLAEELDAEDVLDGGKA